MTTPSPLRALLLLSSSLLVTGCGADSVIVDPPRPACKVHAECPDDKVCFAEECHPTISCVERKNCRTVPVCQDDRCFCDETTNRCLPACVTDNDCAVDGYCVDGVCTTFPVEFGGLPPTGNTRGALRVGLARVPLDYPMGVELAGYGSRQGPRGPYTEVFGGSNAWFDRPDVRAAAFDDGKELFVLLRLPLSWTVDFLVAQTELKVQERTGLDLHGKIITSAPHSHSQPARFWHLVQGLGFGFFGYGEWSWELFDRITDSFADAVQMALEDRRPARLGHLQIAELDPEDRIHRDRRSQNDNLPAYLKKDDRLTLIRIDDDSGAPIAIMANFGVHGTVFDSDNPVITGDAGIGVEMELTHAASTKYGRPVLGFFLQGNAGDQSPAGDDRGHSDFERVQLLGRRTWAAIEQPFDTLATKSEVVVAVATQRIPITHDVLGYEGASFFDTDVSCEGAPSFFRYGAFQCAEGGLGRDTDPGTMFSDGDLNCIFAVECLSDGRPVPQFQKTVLSVIRLGGLALATMPGEPLSNFGRDVSERVKASISGITDAAVLGYSMDHHFYLMKEDDWLQGGYEPSRDIWGWKFGTYLADRSVSLASELNREPEARMIDNQNLKPEWWTGTAEEKAWVPFTETSGDPAEILQDVPATVERLSEVNLAWAGGHPGIDLPYVSFERQTGNGAFEPLRRPGGTTYDSDDFETITSYEGRCTRSNCDDHRWRLRWQEGRDFPLGRYRLHVTGHAWKAGAKVEYQTYSGVFEVVPSTKLWIYGIEANAAGFSGVIVEPPQVKWVDANGAINAEPNAFYLRSVDTPARIGAALPTSAPMTASGRIRLPSGASETLSGEITLELVSLMRQRVIGLDAAGGLRTQDDQLRPTTRFSIASAGLGSAIPGDYGIQLTLTDALGNSGTITATISR